MTLSSFLFMVHALDWHHTCPSSSRQILSLLSQWGQLHSHFVIGFPVSYIRTFHHIVFIVHSVEPVLLSRLIEIWAAVAFIPRHLGKTFSFPLRGHIRLRLRHVSITIVLVYFTAVCMAAVLSKPICFALSTFTTFILTMTIWCIVKSIRFPWWGELDVLVLQFFFYKLLCISKLG